MLPSQHDGPVCDWMPRLVCACRHALHAVLRQSPVWRRHGAPAQPCEAQVGWGGHAHCPEPTRRYRMQPNRFKLTSAVSAATLRCSHDHLSHCHRHTRMCKHTHTHTLTRHTHTRLLKIHSPSLPRTVTCRLGTCKAWPDTAPGRWTAWESEGAQQGVGSSHPSPLTLHPSPLTPNP
jgi:hypothetical protein